MVRRVPASLCQRNVRPFVRVQGCDTRRVHCETGRVLLTAPLNDYSEFLVLLFEHAAEKGNGFASSHSANSRELQLLTLNASRIT